MEIICILWRMVELYDDDDDDDMCTIYNTHYKPE